MSVPQPFGSLASDLDGVSCVSNRFCVAVGSYVAGQTRSLSELWNGSVWSLVPSPKLGGPQYSGSLSSVSCVSTQDCAAVGSKYGARGFQFPTTVAESWNGTSWIIQSSANSPGAAYTYLDGVSCLQSGRCFAVGASGYTSGKYVAVVEVEGILRPQLSTQVRPTVRARSGDLLAHARRSTLNT